MDEQAFWKIVDEAKAEAGDDLEARADSLSDALRELAASEVQGFQRQFDLMMKRAFRWDLWGAAYLMNGGCSDDGFHYFREWLISEGRQAFETALADPDSLAESADYENYELESFGYVALEVLQTMGVAPLARDPALSQSKPSGDPWDEDDLAAMFPKLAARFDS